MKRNHKSIRTGILVLSCLTMPLLVHLIEREHNSQIQTYISQMGVEAVRPNQPKLQQGRQAESKTIKIEVRDVSASSACDFLPLGPEVYAQIDIPGDTIQRSKVIRKEGPLDFKVTKTFAAGDVPEVFTFFLELRDRDSIFGDSLVHINPGYQDSSVEISYYFSTKTIRVKTGQRSYQEHVYPYKSIYLSGHLLHPCRGSAVVQVYETL